MEPSHPEWKKIVNRMKFLKENFYRVDPDYKNESDSEDVESDVDDFNNEVP